MLRVQAAAQRQKFKKFEEKDAEELRSVRAVKPSIAKSNEWAIHPLLHWLRYMTGYRYCCVGYRILDTLYVMDTAQQFCTNLQYFRCTRI